MVGQQVFAGEATRLAYMTDEAVEGRDAFLEKRDPGLVALPVLLLVLAAASRRSTSSRRRSTAAARRCSRRPTRACSRRCDPRAARARRRRGRRPDLGLDGRARRACCSRREPAGVGAAHGPVVGQGPVAARHPADARRAGLQVLVRSLLAGTEPVVLHGPTTVEAFEAATGRLTGPRRLVSLVPTQLRRLVASPALREYDVVLLGGAAAPPELLEQARGAGVRVVTTYGMSETSGGCVYDGVPLPGVTVEAGERIRLCGSVVARGYRLRPDLTAELFDGQCFTTSDRGVLVDGRLVVQGRTDDVLVTGGENVAPAAVGGRALAAHPSVAEVAVVGRPDAEWGQRVVAVVVLRGPLSWRRRAASWADGCRGRTRPAEPAGGRRAAAAAVRQDRPHGAARVTTAAQWLQGARPAPSRRRSRRCSSARRAALVDGFRPLRALLAP
jgi:hypothetical protein